MSVRIIAGSHRGRRLLAPPGLETRPLPDRIKQSLFDWLGQGCDGLTVADICAGSGSFGFEALSRGASTLHLVESSFAAVSVLQANLRGLGSPPGVHLHARDFRSVLPGLNGLDVIFCDPPFPWFAQQPEALSQLLELCAGALAASGRLVIRGERGSELPALPPRLRESARRFYGRSWVAILVLVPRRPG